MLTPNEDFALRLISARLSKLELIAEEKERMKGKLNPIDQSTHVLGSAIVTGAIQEGKAWRPLSMPVDAFVGIAAHVVGFVTDPRLKTSARAHAVGDGAFAAFAYRMGEKFGSRMK